MGARTCRSRSSLPATRQSALPPAPRHSRIGSDGGTSYTIGIFVGGYYTDDASTENEVITVAAPITSYFITGGGFLTEVSSAGLYAADAATKANFGFNVKFNKGGKRLQGNVNILFRKGGHTYQSQEQRAHLARRDAIAVHGGDCQQSLQGQLRQQGQPAGHHRPQQSNLPRWQPDASRWR